MEEVISKALGPFPMLQFFFGISVLGLGIWAVVRGLRGKEKENYHVEDKRAEWEAYNQLQNIEENSFKTVEHLKTQNELHRQYIEQLKALTSAIWNRGV